MFALPIFPGRPTYCDRSEAKEVLWWDRGVGTVRWTVPATMFGAKEKAPTFQSRLSVRVTWLPG